LIQLLRGNDITQVVVGYEPASPGKFLRVGISMFAGGSTGKPLPTQRQILQLAEQFFPHGVPWQVVPLVQRAFELWSPPLQVDAAGATIEPPGTDLPSPGDQPNETIPL